MSVSTYLRSYIGPQILETTHSDVNGEIIVQKFFGRNRISVGGLTQSGEYVADLLGKAVRDISRQKKNIQKILVLGIGGGSAIAEINRSIPSAHIVGVEIDAEMITMGKKYLYLHKAQNLSLIIDDAVDFLTKKNKDRFDVIIVDIYLGYRVPKTVESETFLAAIHSHLRDSGIFLCNRLYFDPYKKVTDDFIEKLKTIFSAVKTRKIYSNLLIFSTR